MKAYPVFGMDISSASNQELRYGSSTTGSSPMQWRCTILEYAHIQSLPHSHHKLWDAVQYIA